MTEEKIKMMTDEAIIKVCRLLGDVNADEIKGKDRTFRVATARQLVMWYLFNVRRLGWSDIGRAMGKHHATVMYGERQAGIMIERNRTKEDRRIYAAASELRKEARNED